MTIKEQNIFSAIGDHFKNENDILKILTPKINQNAINANNQSLLYFAFAKRRYKVAHRLLDLGANANVGIVSYPSPNILMSIACNYESAEMQPKNIDLMHHLIRCGADINAANEDGWTPLIYCAFCLSRTKESMILRLLDAGANPQAKHLRKLSLLNDRSPLYDESNYAAMTDIEFILADPLSTGTSETVIKNYLASQQATQSVKDSCKITKPKRRMSL